MKIKKIPKRVILAIGGFLGVVNAYLMRAFLSVTIIHMIPTKQKSLAFTELHNWSESTRGTIMSSFYIGYVLAHIPGSYLSERYGGKMILNLGLLSTAICTFITPFVVQIGGSDGLIVLRFLMGIGEAPTFPALGSMLSAWFPPKERGVLSSIVFGGVQLGSVLGHITTGIILDNTSGWGYVFFVYGAVGVAWNILFHFIAYNKPGDHPGISDEEKEYLKNEIGVLTETQSFFNVPWTSLLTSAPVWSVIIAQFGHDYALFYLISSIPTYFHTVLKMSKSQAAWYGSLPYILSWFMSIGSGACGDYLINSGKIGRTMSRKMFTFFANMLPVLFVMGASYAGFNKGAVVSLFILAVGSIGFYYAGNRVNILDLCPNYTATLVGLVNGIGAIGGIVANELGGKLISKNSNLEERLSEYRNVFWISFGVLCICTAIYVIWGSGEVQSWNDNGNEDNWMRSLSTRCRRRKVEKTANVLTTETTTETTKNEASA